MASEPPTVGEIVDLGAVGPEPSANYLESLNLLDNVTRHGIHVSKDHHGIPSPTTAHFYASVIFTQMLTKCVSLLMLAPHSTWAEKKIEHWDYSSMTGIARTMIELRVAFYYICIEPCPPDEWVFRWNLFNLHDCISRVRMFDALGAEEQAQLQREQADELRERLTSNPFFETIEKNRTKRLLHGQTAYLFPLEVIAERAGVDLRTFRWLYVMFSSHVHALPMSFYRIGGDNPEQGRGLPSPIEESQTALCLTLTATLLVRCRDEFEAIFADYKPAAAPIESTETPMPGVPEPGEQYEVDLTDDVSVRVMCDEDRTIVTTYFDRRTGASVFERADTTDGNVEWRELDPFFWQFSVDGQAVTQDAFEEALGRRHIYRLDPTNRTFLVKTAQEDETGTPISGTDPTPWSAEPS